MVTTTYIVLAFAYSFDLLLEIERADWNDTGEQNVYYILTNWELLYTDHNRSWKLRYYFSPNNYGKMRVFFMYRKLLIITKKERFPFFMGGTHMDEMAGDHTAEMQ